MNQVSQDFSWEQRFTGSRITKKQSLRIEVCLIGENYLQTDIDMKINQLDKTYVVVRRDQASASTTSLENKIWTQRWLSVFLLFNFNVHVLGDSAVFYV